MQQQKQSDVGFAPGTNATPKTVGALGGGSLGIVIAWLWNSLNPENPMPAEVAAAIATFAGTFISMVFNK